MSPLTYVPAIGGVVATTTVALTVVKLLGVGMSWWWVAAPLLIALALSTLCGVVIVLYALTGDKR